MTKKIFKQRKISESKVRFFEKKSVIFISLYIDCSRAKERKYKLPISGERVATTTTDSTNSKIKTWRYYEQICANKFNG